MEHPAPDFHVELGYRDELTYRSAKSPASPEAGLVLCIASALRTGLYSLFDAFS